MLLKTQPYRYDSCAKIKKYFYTIVTQIIEIEQFSTVQYGLVELDGHVSLHKSKDVQQGYPKILILVKVCGFSAFLGI